MTDKIIPNNVLPFARPVPVHVTYPYSADAALAHPDVAQFIDALSDEDRAALLADRSVFVWAEFAATMLTGIKFEAGRVLRKACGVSGFGTADWQPVSGNPDFPDALQWISADRVQVLRLARHACSDLPDLEGKLPTAQQWADNTNATNRNLIAEKPQLAERIAAGHLVGAAQRVLWLRLLLQHGTVYRNGTNELLLDTSECGDLPSLDKQIGPMYPAALRRLLPPDMKMRFA